MLEEPRCYDRMCKHLQGVAQPDGTEESEVYICPAFPKGIPDRITHGPDNHVEVAPDQVGSVVYEREEQ